MSPRIRKTKSRSNDSTVQTPEPYKANSLFKDVMKNLQHITSIFDESPELCTKVLDQSPVPLAMLYLHTLADESKVEENILKPLLEWEKEGIDTQKNLESMKKGLNSTSEIKEETTFKGVTEALLTGHVILFIQDCDLALVITVEQTDYFRKVEESKVQTLVRGPREGFVEDIDTNMALIRRRTRTPKLSFEQHCVGKDTRTKVYVTYVRDLVDQQVLDTLTKRIEQVDTDKILESGMLEELIVDPKYTPFPTMKATERPDIVAGEILDGKIAIVVDGTPFVLIAPVTFTSFFQIAEDYYEKFDLATFIRGIRLLAFCISLALPAGYIAVTTFHAELLETNILINLAAQREGVPFPAFMEVFIMEIIFELLREAGIRMPRPIGSAISIVGALVIGEAAVAAGFISAAMVIVVSLTAISSFISPYYAFSGASRLIRFLFILFAAAGGFFGMVVLMIALVIHLSSVTSIGRPYLSPISPFEWKKWKDAFFRFPIGYDKSQWYQMLVKLKRRMSR